MDEATWYWSYRWRKYWWRRDNAYFWLVSLIMFLHKMKSVGTHICCYQCLCGGTCTTTTLMLQHIMIKIHIIIHCCVLLWLVAIMVTHILQAYSTGTGEIGYPLSVKQPWVIWINSLNINSSEAPVQYQQNRTKQIRVYIVWVICPLPNGIAICLSNISNVLRMRKLFLKENLR